MLDCKQEDNLLQEPTLQEIPLYRITLIGITGKIGSGKTTLAKKLCDDHGYTELSFATPLKKIGEIFGFTQEQLYGTQTQKMEINDKRGVSAREFLQKIGTEVFREYIKEIMPNFKIERSIWVDLLKEEIMKGLPSEKIPSESRELPSEKIPSGSREPSTELYKYVVSDVRFQDEADMIKELGGIIIKTVRNCDEGSHEHKSETELENIKYDFLIDNN
jgi:hypothetical protein